MITITTQELLDKFIQSNLCELEEFGINITEDIIFHLNGKHFEIDARGDLLCASTDIIFRGNGADKTFVKFTNCEQVTSHFEDKEVDIFAESMFISFEDVFITANHTLEIRFTDDEELSRWKNIGLNTAYVLIANEDKIHDEFMEWFSGYDVDGALSPGDHVVVNRGYYTHHGIYIGNNKIIHYSGEPGTSGIVCDVSLKIFAKNNSFWVERHTHGYPPSEIIQRAKSRLGENEYNLMFNNCEHFCQWCCNGSAKSKQLNAVLIFGISGLWLTNEISKRSAQNYALE